MINTAESISNWHPDKVCDLIADTIVAECLRQDPKSRCAIEVLGGHDLVFISGEVTTKAKIDYSKTAKTFYFNHTGKTIGVMNNIVTQSPDIALGVDKGGAGDQGIMFGYACNENPDKIPQEKYLANKLLEPFETDAKSQVTIKDGIVTDIVLSVQGKTQTELNNYVKHFCKTFLHNQVKKIDIFCNWTGKFEIGGFDADCGVTGRKIVCDQYGPRVPVGGGAFSGKDFTKVDRSGAYMARWIALDLLKKHKANEVLVKLAYVIGKKQPVMQVAIIDGQELAIPEYDCQPCSIIKKLKLSYKNLDFLKTTYVSTKGYSRS